MIVSNNVSATQDDVSECQSIACTLNKIISSTGDKFWAFFPVLSEILHRQRIIHGRPTSKYVSKHRCIHPKDNGLTEKNYGNLILEIVLRIL